MVAEKTGYPKDMLDLDLDLEADLGVDTVKQAEMFAAIRESTTSRATRISSCATSPRLAHVIRFVYEKRPDLLARLRASRHRQYEVQPRPRRPGRSRRA